MKPLNEANDWQSEGEKFADKVESIITDLEPEQYHDILLRVGYRRPWRPQHAGWVNIKDQFLHVVYAFMIFAPVLIWPSYWTAAASGFLAGGLREWEQYKGQDFRILMFWDRLQDAAFFLLGATVVYFISQL